MKEKRAELLLAGLIVARSTSLLLSKITMNSMEPFNLMALRFTAAFLIMAVIFHRKLIHISKGALLKGIILGGTFFAVMTLELFSLRISESSTTSFLENTAIVWVPVLAALIGRRSPDRKTLISASVALAGVAFLTLGKSGFNFGLGQVLALGASFFYAGAILLTARFSREEDPLTLGIVQIGTIGALAGSATFLLEAPHLPQTGSVWAAVAYLAVVCSCFGFTLQPLAQSHVSAEKAGLFCALNPLSAGALGIVFLHESFGIFSVAGAALILTAILIQSVKPGMIRRLKYAFHHI